MAAIGDTDCAGLMIVRVVKKKIPAAGKNKNKNGRGGAGSKLQMLILETNQNKLTLPKDEIEDHENELIGAQRATQEKVGFAPDDYSIFQEFGFVMEDTTPECNCNKTLYWIALLDENETPIRLAREYKTYYWVDFSVIQNMGLVKVGRMGPDIGKKLGDLTNTKVDGLKSRIEAIPKYRDMEL